MQIKNKIKVSKERLQIFKVYESTSVNKKLVHDSKAPDGFAEWKKRQGKIKWDKS